MENNSPARTIIDTLVQHRKWWLIPMLVCTLASVLFALFAQKSYTSRQSMVVRDDLVGTFFKPGRFDSLDSLKSAQETILEVARRPQVVRAALEQVGPPALFSEESWLGEQNIQNMQGKIQISAPNGAEFGRTEAIVLSVQQGSRDRAGKFVDYLFKEVESTLRELRGQQFESMQQELQQAASIAEKSYLETANSLRSFERHIGADLSTLISLNDAQAGTNNLQSELTDLSIEQRKAWVEVENVKKQIQSLGDVSGQPESLLEVPQELLQLQPTLAHLAKGLNEAIIAYSKSKGRYQQQHPKVREDFRAVVDIKQRITDKLERTLGSLRRQLELRESNHQRITQLIDQKKHRLSELSSVRVDYATLRQDVSKKREINNKAQASLAEIVSLGTSAKKVSLISRIGEPQTELYPDGPSNKAIVFGGMIGGLMIGLGLVMFVSPVDGGGNPAPIDRGNPNSPPQQFDDRPSRSNRDRDKQSPGYQTSAVSRSTNLNSISEAIRRQKSVQAETASDPNSLANTGNNNSVESPTEFDKHKQRESTTAGYTGQENSTKSVPASQLTEPFGKATANDTHFSSDSETPEYDLPIRETVDTSLDTKPIDGLVLPESNNAPSQPPTIAESESNTQEQWTRPDNFSADDFDSRSAEELAAEITDSITANNSDPDSVDERLDAFFSENVVIEEQTDETSTPLIGQTNHTANFVDASEKVITHDYDASESNESLENLPREIDIPEIPVSGEVVEPNDSSFNYTDVQLPVEIADESVITPPISEAQETESSSAIFSTLYEDGNSQILEAAEASPIDIDESALELSSLRLGKNDQRNLAEKLNQLEQDELRIEDTANSSVSSITEDAVNNLTGQVDEPPYANPTGMPLETSIENSALHSEGHESDPVTGIEPDNRPTATTVDLRMLKEQLAGKAKDTPSKPLSEILGKDVHDSDATPASDPPLDQSISDLANSIRDICQRQDPPDNDS